MATQKLILSLAIVAIAAIISQVNSKPQVGHYAANQTNKSHDLTVGYRQPGDKLVLQQHVVKKSSWMQIVTEEKTFNVTNRGDRITAIMAYDQKTDGNGAYVTVLSGGPGSSYVTLRFKSQRGHGINFDIQLYARY